LYIYLFTQGRGRGSGEPERRGEGQHGRVQMTKLRVENTNMTECTQEITPDFKLCDLNWRKCR
jgi:hypothetical protein